jgi:VWFA-related protein
MKTPHGLILSLLFLSRMSGQIAPAEDEHMSIKVEVNVVNVLCTIHDKQGALAKDLRREDFEILDNGEPQQIRYFARETDLPLTIALLVDVSGSVSRFVQSEKATAVRFFEEVLRPGDQALLTGFSSTVVVWKDLTSSVSALQTALEEMHAIPFRGLPKDGGPMPTTLLYDAVSSTEVNKLKGVSGRKTMVIISDGWDIGSRANLDMGVRSEQAINTTVYCICYPNPHASGCFYLKNLSEPTGGRMFDLRSKTPLSEIFQTIENELRTQYSLGFVPTNSTHDGKFHKLKVNVRPRGMRVQTRKGYYADM